MELLNIYRSEEGSGKQVEYQVSGIGGWGTVGSEVTAHIRGPLVDRKKMGLRNWECVWMERQKWLFSIKNGRKKRHQYNRRKHIKEQFIPQQVRPFPKSTTDWVSGNFPHDQLHENGWFKHWWVIPGIQCKPLLQTPNYKQPWIYKPMTMSSLHKDLKEDAPRAVSHATEHWSPKWYACLQNIIGQKSPKPFTQTRVAYVRQHGYSTTNRPKLKNR